MNAELFKHPYAIGFGSLSPQAGDNLSIDWANRVTKMVIRAAGFAGSSIVPLTENKTQRPIFSESGHTILGIFPVYTFTAQASFSLPDGAYGSTHPPMIWPSVRYGNTIHYKQYVDFFGKLNSDFDLTGVKTSRFRTWITDLHYDELPTGSYRWSFTVNHTYESGNDMFDFSDSMSKYTSPGKYRSPYHRLKSAFWPNAMDIYGSQAKVALYYYALGADPNLFS
jgi:hypothetical protein